VRCHLLLVLSFASCAAVAPSTHDAVATPTGQLVARLERAAYDPARHADTCKVFHHVFAPDGRLLTKGLGGEYPHHRGLFVGWNRMRWHDRAFDFWHCSHRETQQFRRFVPAAELGLDATWQVAGIDWCTDEGAVVIDERRAVRARELGTGTTALDVVIELRATDGPVQLAGDPQHSGQQFRAAQQFAEPRARPVRYVRPADAEGGKDDVWTGCAWIAAVLPLEGGPVTVLRIEGRDNPKPATWSTRPYGRFGATFAHELLPGKPLRLSFTYVIALGERDAAWCAATAASP